MHNKMSVNKAILLFYELNNQAEMNLCLYVYVQFNNPIRIITIHIRVRDSTQRNAVKYKYSLIHRKQTII